MPDHVATNSHKVNDPCAADVLCGVELRDLLIAGQLPLCELSEWLEHARQTLAALGGERLGCSRTALIEALTGRVRDHHRFLLAQHLRTIEQLEESVAAFAARRVNLS